MSGQSRYVIRVRGHLSERWQALLEGATVENLPGGEALITVTIADQAALYGTLFKLQGLGVPLLAFSQLEAPEGT